MAKETTTQRKRRLLKAKQKRQEKLQHESEASRYARLAKQRERAKEFRAKHHNVEHADAKKRHAQTKANETADELICRLENERARKARSRAMETAVERISRLKSDKLRHRKLRARESSQERETRLRRRREAYAQRVAGKADFHSVMNTFCDKCCDNCQDKCILKVVKYRLISPKP